MKADGKSNPSKGGKKRSIWFLLVIPLVAVFVWAMPYGGIRESDVIRIETGKLGDCLAAVKAFEQETGRFPNALEEVFPEDGDEYYTFGWKPNVPRSFLYHKATSDNVPILMSQHRLKRKHNVVFFSGRSEMIHEAAYLKFRKEENWNEVSLDYLRAYHPHLFVNEVPIDR